MPNSGAKDSRQDQGGGRGDLRFDISHERVEKPAQFRMKVVSDVLLLSYLDKFGLSLTVEAGQALAILYSKARLYKGPSLAGLSQSTATRSTGNISV